MKTTIIVEVETPDVKNTRVVEEAGKSEEDYTKEELFKFRSEYSKDLHNYVIGQINSFLDPKNEELIEQVMESDYGVEDWEELDDYGIKIKTKTKAQPKKQ